MIPGGVPSRIGPLLNSLPIHPSSVNGRYQLCVLFPYPTLLASRARYEERYEAGLLARKTLLGSTPLALTVALVEPGLSTGLLF